MLSKRNLNIFNYEEPENGEIKGNQKNRIKKSKHFIIFTIFVKAIIYVVLVIPLYHLYNAINWFIKKPKSIKGKICLVTGAGRGLGRELCLKLSNLGAEIICVDIVEEANNETVKLIKQSGGKAHGYICNVAKYEDVNKLAKNVQKDVGRVYLLVNNAALIMAHQASDWPPEDVISTFNVNVMGHYWTINKFLPAMKEINEGHIVNILSISSFFECPSLSVYGPSKAAADNMLRILRLELNFNRNNQIKVTGVYPNVINTSADIKTIFKGGMSMLDMHQVTDAIIEGILYEADSVYIPKSLRILEIIMSSRFIPDWFVTEIFAALKIKVNEKRTENTLFRSIRNKCL